MRSALPAVVVATWLAPLAGAQVTDEFRFFPPEPGASDLFGRSAAVSGDTAVIAASRDSNPPGHLYVYRGPNPWILEADIEPADGQFGDLFGYTLSMSQDTIAVGAYSHQHPTGRGAVYVFTRSGTVWSQEAELVPSNATPNDLFGFGVVVRGNKLFVADPSTLNLDDLGSVYVFERTGTIWTEIDELFPTDPVNDSVAFGQSVDYDGVRLAVGARDGASSTSEGAVYVFEETGGGFQFEQKIVAATPSIFDNMGGSVTIDGDALVAGPPRTQLSIVSGYAYVFELEAGVWTEIVRLTAPVPTNGDLFGSSLDLQGNRLLVGEPVSAFVPGTGDPGAAHIFKDLDSGWTHVVEFAASDGEPEDRFGTSVGMDGSTLVIGALGNDQLGQSAGAAYAYEFAEPECFLVLGNGPGLTSFRPLDHTFFPLLDEVVESHPVLMDHLPEFAVSDSRSSGFGPTAIGRGFWVQVMMYNPVVFPQQPERRTAGLHAFVDAHGRLRTRYYGEPEGMGIRAELSTDGQGATTIRFPFTIEGL